MRAVLIAICLFVAAPSYAETINSSAGVLRIEPVMTGLNEPWAIGFLPDGRVLVTERDGRLLLLRPDGAITEVKHNLDVQAVGQGGLLDVMVPRDFASSQQVFLSYAKKQGRHAGTALAVGTLSRDGMRLVNTRVLFELTRGSRGGRHFGSRIVEGRDGTLFLTIGDRGDGASAQDLSVENGSVIRINRDGTIPSDNPFISAGKPAIWSYGHRNPQGATLDRRGQLWVVEHGARGGDEVNRVNRGVNYGWPIISYGTHYTGIKIGEGTQKAGMEQPEHYWDPSIAPSGMMVYSGKRWPQWQGDMFIGSLKFDYISRLNGAQLTEVEMIASPQTGRVRDVREAPDGSIWFLSVNDGALYRITPG